jgi:hypothetical protein
MLMIRINQGFVLVSPLVQSHGAEVASKMEKRGSGDGGLAEPRTRNTWLSLVVALLVAVLTRGGLVWFGGDRQGTGRAWNTFTSERACAHT